MVMANVIEPKAASYILGRGFEFKCLVLATTIPQALPRAASLVFWKSIGNRLRRIIS